jgi:hypothetical protein
MPLTRHLYREDEVVASLMFCCLRGRIQEAAFWCLELLESGLADELILAARRTWLYGFGIGAPSWIVAFEEAVKGDAVDADRILELVVELARLGANKRHDSSVVVLMAITWKNGIAASHPPLQQCLETGAIVPVAWTVLRCGDDMPAAWKAIGDFALKKHGGAAKEWVTGLRAIEDVEEWPRLAVALAAVCLGVKELAAAGQAWTARPIGAEVAAAVDQWRGLLGRRTRRAFAVHPDSIAWLTERGRNLSVYDTNEKELWRLERPTGLWGSQFWDEAAEEFGGWGAVRDGNGDSREAFYTHYFPDDIPDEWSRAERAKSHGSGVLQRGAQPDPVRWLRNWFGAYLSAGIQEGMKGALRALEGACERGAGPKEPADFWKGCAQSK